MSESKGLQDSGQTPAVVIKQATAAAHLHTEKLLVRHVKQVRSPGDYAALLTCMHGFFSPLERKLEEQIRQLLPDHSLRRKAGNILQDLGELQQGLPLSEASELPVVNGEAAVLGAYYVMEGSTLGGTVITRVIRSNNPAIPAGAFTFFSGYGDQNLAMWQSFIARFNALLTDELSLQQAIDAANETFTKLEKWIEFYYGDQVK